MELESYRGSGKNGTGSRPSCEPVHRTLYDELCRGRILEPSRAKYRRGVSDLVPRGCRRVILERTEVGLLVPPSDATFRLMASQHRQFIMQSM